jgi:hypothetical protein
MPGQLADDRGDDAADHEANDCAAELLLVVYEFSWW